MISCQHKSIAPQGALIQRGGGNGPAMPRQPASQKVILRQTLKRCQFRQTEVLGDERASLLKIDCPFCSSEGAISFLREFENNEQYFHDGLETDVHLRISDRGTSRQALRSDLR